MFSLITITQKVVDVLKPREAYLLFLGKGGGSAKEFGLLPRPLNAGEDVLHEACRRSIISEVHVNEPGKPLENGGVWQMACEEIKSNDVEIGGAV